MDITRIVDDLNKTYGKDTVRKATDLEPLSVLPIGIPNFDIDIGGGLPWGREIIFAGDEATAKTSTAYYAAKAFQAIGGPVFWVDLEKSFDAERAKLFGVDVDNNFAVVRGEYSAENAYAIVRDILHAFNQAPRKNDRKVLVIVDSIAMMITDALFEQDASSQYGGSARVINQSLGVWAIKCSPNQIVLCINQLRQSMERLGDPNKMPGGEGQMYFASGIIWFRNGESLKEGTQVVGKEIRWTIKKSRMSPPKEIGSSKFYFETGYDLEENIVLTAIELGLIEQSGAWYTVGTDRFHGREAVITKLKEDKDFLAMLKSEIYKQTKNPVWDGVYKE